MSEIFKISQDITGVSADGLTGTLSGVVKSGGNPVARQIFIYKNNDPDVLAAIWSDPSNGTWSLNVSGSGNDRFRVIIVGDYEENSVVYENVKLS